MDRREVTKLRSPLGGLRIHAVHAVDADHAPVLLAFPRSADRAADAVADSQAETADLARRDVDIVRSRHQAVAAHEPEAFVHDVEDARGVGVTGEFALADQDLVHELFLGGGAGLHFEFLPDGLEFVDGHPA